MSENNPVVSSGEPVVCPHCHRGVIGEVRTVEGLEILFIGNVPVEQLKCRCPVCNQVIFWSINERMLAALIKKVVNKTEI